MGTNDWTPVNVNWLFAFPRGSHKTFDINWLFKLSLPYSSWYHLGVETEEKNELSKDITKPHQTLRSIKIYFLPLRDFTKKQNVRKWANIHRKIQNSFRNRPSELSPIVFWLSTANERRLCCVDPAGLGGKQCSMFFTIITTSTFKTPLPSGYWSF